MTSPFFGFLFNQQDDTLPPILSDFSVGAIVTWSDDANPSVFPLNTPAAVNSGDTAVLAGAGTGELYKSLLRINAQLATFQRSARLCVVRVAAAYASDGVTINKVATMANVLGSASAKTGLYALLTAPQVCNLVPRLIITPGGITGIMSYGVVSPVVTNEGSGYTNPVVSFTPPGAAAAATVGNAGVQATATAAIGNPGVQATGHATLGTGGTAGQVSGVMVDAGGQAYRTAPAVTFTGGAGTGAAAHAVLTNGIVTSIVVDTPGTGYTSAPTIALAAPPTGQITGVSVSNGGQNYASAPAVTFSGGGGTGAAAHAVLTNGLVSSIVIDSAGSGYTTPPTVAIGAPAGGEITAINLTSPGNYPPGTTVTMAIADSQGGTGSGAIATVSLELLANPVCGLLPTIANSLLAHSLVAGPGGTVQDALNWRATLNSQRLIPQDDWEIVETIDGTSTEYLDGTARTLGLAIATDFEHNGYPFHAWANRPIVDALGVKRPDGFSLTDGATDGQVLLTAGIGITARGDASDTSIDDSGFVAISVNNATSDGDYNLYNKTRGSDFINLALIKTIRLRLGKTNVTRKGVDAVLNDMTAINVQIQSLDDPGIVGFKVGFNAADNTVAGLRAGKFTVYDDTEIPAPITQITINRGLDADAETTLLQELASDGTSSTAS